MAADPPGATRFSLRRWSQRKLDAARSGDPRRPEYAAPPPAGANDADKPAAAAGDAAVVGTGSLVAAREAAPIASANAAAPRPLSGSGDATAAPPGDPGDLLPPIESLTSDSDFAPFMRPGVDETVRRGALKQLFRDPRFNVMDGLDVYIDDYSKPSPIEPELVRKLVQARYIFDPPQTRVNAQGHAEDVPDEPVPNPDEPSAAQLADAGREDAAVTAAPAQTDVPPDPDSA